MSDRPIVVLKLGSSVLCNEDCLPDAVSEIYRWYREGNDVIAVVSAIGETTDALFAQAHRLSPDASHHYVASLVATGELTSASLVGLALDRVGVPCGVLDHRQLGVRARGEALDEDPVSLNVDGLKARLAHVPVLVAPGYLGVDERDRTVLLGRGGSDLTAVFIAEQVGAARCRLIKDVNGVYDRDPNAVVTPPIGADAGASWGARKFKSISFDHAHQLSGAILQHKATAFAERRRFPFEVAALQSDRPSLVGADECELIDDDEPLNRTRVALLGLGSVGGGVARRLLDSPWRFEITGVLVRSIDRQRDIEIDQSLLTDDPADVFDGEPDVLIDCLADTHRSRQLICSALRRGIDVISASKAAIALSYDDFWHEADRSGASIRISGAVGGSVPVLERVRGLAVHRGVQFVRCVLNGSTNFILDAVENGDDLEHAIARARLAGICEGDATDDLNGLDAARKLSIIAQHGLGLRLDPYAVPRFDSIDPLAVRQAVAAGSVTRQIAGLALDAQGRICEARIGPEQIKPDDPLAAVTAADNAVVVTCADGRCECIRGAGAGRWPTTESVWADLCDVVRRRRCAGRSNRHQAALTEVSS